ncbi:hypothetical protein F5887DRAFT_1004759 [Amanita rubescens]|nr:hypothetical protein F5887DRAFT_1004759 [Amanita rubescens]
MPVQATSESVGTATRAGHATSASLPITDPAQDMRTRRSSTDEPATSSSYSSAADHPPTIPKLPSLNTRPLPNLAPRSSSLPFAFMGQGHSTAPSPSIPSPPTSSSSVSVASKGFQAALAGGSRLKRAIVSRRKKSEDVSQLFGFGNKREVQHEVRQQAQEQQFRHLRVESCVPLTSSSSKGRVPSNSSNPTLMMAADQLIPLSPTPPTPPPKPRPSPQYLVTNETPVLSSSHTLEQVPSRSQSVASPDSRSSVIPLSPGITSAVTLIYINEKDKEQGTQGVRSKTLPESREADTGHEVPRLKPKEADAVKSEGIVVADIKESRRKSDSTMSYHTIRPGTTSNRASRPVSMAESLQSNHTIKPVRISALIADGDFTMLEEDDDTCKDQDAVDASRPPTIITTPQKGSPEASLKTKSRRSLSFNLGPYASKTQPPSPPTHHPTLSLSEIKYPSYSVTEGMPPPISPLTPSVAKEVPKIVQTSATGQTGPIPAPRSQRKLPPLPPQMQLPTIMSNSPSHLPPAPRAISMTSSLAPSAGRAFRGAVGRMGRAMGISSSSSNSATASGYPSTTSDGQNLTRTNSNQSSSASHPYSPMGWARRRTPDAPSGTWSVAPSLASTSASDIDHLGVPSGPVLGLMLRAPFKGSGVVFAKELKMAVRETAIGITPPAGEGRRAGEWVRAADTEKRSKMRDVEKALEERRLPAVIVRCAQHILVWGVEEEGLFRVGGRPKHVSALRSEFDKGADYDLASCEPGDLDPHAVASVFKAFFRELPEHMLTPVLLPYFEGLVEQETAAAGAATESKPRNADVKPASHGLGLPSGPKPGSLPPGMKKPPSLSTLAVTSFKDMRPPSNSLIRAIRALISQLPEENRHLLRTLVDVINATSTNEKETKMPLSNLLLVFYPSVQITPPLLKILCETKEIWDEEMETPIMDVKREKAGSSASSTSEIYSDAPDGMVERESLSGGIRTSEDHTSSLSDHQASAEGSIDLVEGLARRRPSPRPRRDPESTVYMDAECSCSSTSLLLHELSSSVDSSMDNSFLSSDKSPNEMSPSSTPPMTSSVESLATPATSSGQPSLPHLPIDEGKAEQDVESMSDVMAPESTKYIINDSMSHTGPVHFPSLPASTPLKRRSSPFLSMLHIAPMNATPSSLNEPPSPTTSLHSNSSLPRRPKMKKPSLQIFVSSKHSNCSLRGISKTSISNPIINNDAVTAPHSASDSSVSTPQSAVTAPQGSVYTLPPVIWDGIQVSSSRTDSFQEETEDALTVETTKTGTPIADRYRADSTTSSMFPPTRSARSTPEPAKTSHLRPTPRRPATSPSSNHLGILDQELGSEGDWTHSVLLAADIERIRLQDRKR